MTSQDNETLVEHLEALRKMLIKCLLSLAIGLLPVFLVTPYVMDLLIRVMMRDNAVTLNFFSPMEVFILQIKMAVVLDILLCFPYLAKQVWLFVLPALYEHERRFIKSIVLVSSVLFIFGVLFCLFFILPLVIRFGMSFVTDNIQPVFGIANIVSLALWLSLVFGIMFQFPLVTYALIRADIVSYEVIKNKRAYVFVGILILSGLLTPPDIVSQLMLTLPTYGLFELGLFFAKKQKKD
ncbi:MAG: twin-arginine translocase subunit TatC [Alphaproteobacteria bacterium]|nr:twin-arginine translocase subunit TatC [Alphaproteobacteria bacterium]